MAQSHECVDERSCLKGLDHTCRYMLSDFGLHG
jgi:hypothetical protein